jgi:hypothetical protein
MNSPITPASGAPGPRPSTTTSALADIATMLPCAAWRSNGSASSSAAGKTAKLTTKTATSSNSAQRGLPTSKIFNPLDREPQMSFRSSENSPLEPSSPTEIARDDTSRGATASLKKTASRGDATLTRRRMHPSFPHGSFFLRTVRRYAHPTVRCATNRALAPGSRSTTTGIYRDGHRRGCAMCGAGPPPPLSVTTWTTQVGMYGSVLPASYAKLLPARYLREE